jgi:D-glycero-D-manno-heptose 1,7-bisphosphate phosphatase
VFLDRDGVLNEPVVRDGIVASPRTMEELVIARQAAAAVDRLRNAGYVTVVVTNQPDVGRGALAFDIAEAINRAVVEATGVDALYACYHGGDEVCACRKPRPGLLLDAAADLDLDLARSWLIGDRWVDIAAAVAAGVRGLLVEGPDSWLPNSTGSPAPDLQPLLRGDLDACVTYVVGHGNA